MDHRKNRGRTVLSIPTLPSGTRWTSSAAFGERNGLTCTPRPSPPTPVSESASPAHGNRLQQSPVSETASLAHGGLLQQPSVSEAAVPAHGDPFSTGRVFLVGCDWRGVEPFVCNLQVLDLLFHLFLLFRRYI